MMDTATSSPTLAERRPTALRRVFAVVNAKSGSTDAASPERLRKILADRGIEAEVAAPEPDGMADAISEAVRQAPDVLIVLGGDGTARSAAEIAGPNGPPLILLPGGTMNILPKALYGELAWPEALEAALDRGVVKDLPGAKASSHLFFCAGIFGSPALMAPARELVREGKIGKALTRARIAYRKAFSKRLRARRDESPMEKIEAVAVLCPLISKVDGAKLETALLDPSDTLSAFRLGLGALTGGWRKDPSAHFQVCTTTEIWDRHDVPAVLDGETVSLPSPVRIVTLPRAARVIALEDVGELGSAS